MQSTGRRFSPSLRQSAVGLMLLVSLGLLGWLVLWVANFSFGGRGYKATIIFPNAGGMTSGSRVAYRGVRIGRVLSVEPEPQGVAIEVEISSASTLIPSNSLIEVTQAGLVGESSIDITPLEPLPSEGVEAKPLDPDCNPDVIICNNSRLQGEEALNVNSLIRSLVRISDMIGDPQVTVAIRSLTQKTSDALVNISQLSNQASGLIQEANRGGTIRQLNSTLRTTEQAIGNIRGVGTDIKGVSQDIRGLSNEARALLGDARTKNTVGQLNTTLTSLDSAAKEIRSFLALNRTQISATLASIRGTSEQLRVTVTRLDPILSEVEQGQILKNLEMMSANAAQLTGNLRDLSSNLNDPTSVLMLQQTLDSARSAFQNLQKITSDVDELTGDPQIRQDLMRLIQGLSNLVSSSQNLQQQVQYTQMLSQFSTKIAQKESQKESQKPTLLPPVPVTPATPAPRQP